MTILIAILILGIIIFVHELGHFLAAKFFKIPVSEFAIGMGPKVYSYTTLETVYSIRAIPIGGFVNIEGMEIDSKIKNGFNKKSKLVRFIVLSAGVFMNFLLAFVLLFSSFMINGKATLLDEPIIGGIAKETNASQVLKVNDKILKIDGKIVKKWTDISTIVKNSTSNNEISVEIERDGKKQNVLVQLMTIPQTSSKRIGIIGTLKKENIGVLEAINMAFLSEKEMSIEILKGIKRVVTLNAKRDEVGGPIRIIKEIGTAVEKGFGIIVFYMIFLSVSVGIFNLLPFPALDGGRIIFIFLEMVGIPVNKKIEEKTHFIGMIFLLILFVFVATNDIFSLIN